MIEELTGLINRPERLLSLLQGTSSAPLLPQLLDKLKERGSIDRSHLHEVLHKVIVHADQIEVLISDSAFLRFAEVEAVTEERCQAVWSLRIPVELRQSGGDLRLVLPAARASGDCDDDSALARAVARAHCWLDRILTGRIANARALAKETGFDERYVSRILPLAFLAPDLTEAILDPTRSATAPLTGCPGNLPLVWIGQRSMFGILQQH